ncbi:ABC transporter permease [Chelativorans sp.]|uniref:ABC transporter permease n=1 Tax=Chelativorans sp. TaxID=2203393 RepID=UPI0028121781|nr:ABC transporter permease [Chelativorans sp.]
MIATYIIKRTGMMLIVVAMALTLNFLIPRAMPGDPVQTMISQISAQGGSSSNMQAMVESYQQKFGLDLPLWQQYLNYLYGLMRLDLGYSVTHYPSTVVEVIGTGALWTIGLLGVSTVISFAIGTLLGGLMAWPGTGRWVQVIAVPFLMLSAIPYFVLGLVLLFAFAIVWKFFPASGGFPYNLNLGLNWASFRGVLWHATLPALSIILTTIGAWAISMRGMVVSVLGEDYITLAQAKGLPPARIFLAYGLRNAMLPQFTHLGLALGHVVSGAILVEVIFAYPGLGYDLYQAIQTNDYFVIQGIVLLLSVSIALTMFILDLLYPLIDPRIALR